MTILEIGIFRKSVLLLHKSFYPLSKIIQNQSTPLDQNRKRSTLINQIRKMGEIVLKGDLKVLDNESYRIYFSISNEQEDVFIYAIDDKKSSKEVIQPMLNKLLNRFQYEYPTQSFSIAVEEVGKYDSFSQIIDLTLADERFTPLDRLRNFLL